MGYYNYVSIFKLTYVSVLLASRVFLRLLYIYLFIYSSLPLGGTGWLELAGWVSPFSHGGN